MNALKIIGVILAVVLSVVLLVGLLAPKKYDVSRTIIIAKPVADVFKNVSRYENTKKWSPWQGLDSAIQVKVEGPDGVVGTKYLWTGNDKVGQGEMTFTKIEVNKAVEFDLHFIEPFESQSITYTYTQAVANGTKVIWGMKGKMDFIPRVIMAFMGGMDKAIGKDYEKGLANLKALTESENSATTYTVQEVDWTEKNCLAKRQEVAFADLTKFYGEHYPAMYKAIGDAGAKPGITLGVYYSYDNATMKADVAAAVPYQGKKVLAKGYSNINLPAGKAYLVDFYGDYMAMKPAYDALEAKVKELGKDKASLVVEEYVTDPMVEKDPSKWLTKVYFFVK